LVDGPLEDATCAHYAGLEFNPAETRRPAQMLTTGHSGVAMLLLLARPQDFYHPREPPFESAARNSGNYDLPGRRRQRVRAGPSSAPLPPKHESVHSPFWGLRQRRRWEGRMSPQLSLLER